MIGKNSNIDHNGNHNSINIMNNNNENQSDNNRAMNAMLVALMEKTGYTMVQENGQRKFGGPPPRWEGPPPPKGCEVFVGKIPRNCFEDELVPVFQTIGPIYEMRLMMDFSGSNRGYAFVMYTCTEDAKKAIVQLNNYQLKPGKYIGVVKSVDNCRLFVGGIPKCKTKEEILEEMSRVTEGVVSIILYNSPKDKTKNRGFAFIEYESHRAAAVARRKLMPGRIPLWGQALLVDWAEPEPEVDEETMSKVKVLYARNLMESTTEDVIREKFDEVRPGSVEKVKKLRDFCFVHFATREDAENALELLNGINLDGSVIEVTWAKPPDRAATNRNYLRPALNGPLTAYSYNPTAAYVDTHQFPSPYGVSASSVIAFPNAAAGRGTYVPRSPGRGRGRGAAGLRSGGRVFFPGGASRSTEFPIYNLPPGCHIVPANQLPIRPSKAPTQVLAEYCQKQNLGEPQYQMHSMIQQGNNGNEQLFVYKVHIPALNMQYAPRPFSRSPDEAKQIAANYALNAIGGMNWDGCEALQAFYEIPSSYPVTAAAHY